MPLSEMYEALSSIQDLGIKKLIEKEGEKEIMCHCKWLQLWYETHFWNDIINDYIDLISKETKQKIVCEVGLTKTIQYMIKECDAVSLFYPRSEIEDYEGLLCSYSLQLVVQDHLCELHLSYIVKVGNDEDTYCDECEE